MGKKKTILFFSILLLFSFSTLLSNSLVGTVKAQSIHFYDDFNDNDTSDWTTISDPSKPCSINTNWETKEYGTSNYAFGIRIEDNGCRIYTNSSSEYLTAEQDWIFEMDFYISHTLNNDVNVIFEFKDPSNLMGFYFINNIRNLYKIVNGNYQLLESYNFSLLPNNWHQLKVVKVGPVYEFFIDNNSVGSHRETLPLIDNFGVGLRMGNGANPHSEAWFDNVKVTLLDEEEPKQLNIEDFKQYTGGWEGDEYDNAEEWSTNPTMSRWGCAVTSAAMVLDYYGLGIDPGSLNEWLKSQKDGYTRNGAVMWPAITRYTKENGNTLEFSYLGYSDATFKDEIEASRPPIIKLNNDTYGGNHFIVGKGLTSETDDFTINDPGSSSNPNLSDANDYWGSSLMIGQFKETNTDLSYIVAMLTDGFEVVLNKDGSNVGNEFYQEERPFINPGTQETDEDKTLKSVWYPKPENDGYSFEISGSGFYQLDIYYYDKDGNVKMETIYGHLPEGETHSYPFVFDADNVEEIVAHSVEETFFESLNYFCSIGDINKKGLCRSIEVLTRNAIKIGSRGKTISALTLLENARRKIITNTPQYINYNLSNYLLIKILQISEGLGIN